MSNNYDTLLNKEENKIEPFDKISPKRYIPNIPSVISDMKKNNIYEKEKEKKEDPIQSLIDNNKTNNSETLKETNGENLNTNDILKEKEETNTNNNKNFVAVTCDYWNTFLKNDTVSTIINPFQDDGEYANKIYKIYSCITCTLLLIVILLSITLS